VRFVGELTSVVRNSDDEIIEGDASEIKRQRDVWTFARTMGDRTIPTGSWWRQTHERCGARADFVPRTGRRSLASGHHAGVAEISTQLIDFSELNGWEDDDHAAALAVFRNTCMDLTNRTGKVFAPLPRRRPTHVHSSSCFFDPF
jgi:hypothetical protein